MKILYILVLSLPLMNGLVNNNTDTCQCTCQKPYLGDPGDDLFDIVKKPLKYFMETKFILVRFLVNLWIYVGFNLCLNKWCLQSGTNNQYTTCRRVSEDGRTCYSPSIKYGYWYGYGNINIGYGYPARHNNNNYLQWCQQLFPKSTIISSSVTYSNTKPTNFVGSLFWCSSYDEYRPHWCAWLGGYWLNRQLPAYTYLPIVDSLTCLPKTF